MTAPDVVYVVRANDRNEELRYSLRSLRNLPHGKVWIAGYCPTWVKDVGVIPVKGGHGHRSAKANLKAACQHPDVSESFMYFNDDFFVMQPHDSLPVMHRGPLADVIKAKTMVNAYVRASRTTMEILQAKGIDTPLMYDLHAPMTVTKSGMLEALSLSHDPMIQERSLYGNLNAVGGERRRNYKHGRTDKGLGKWPFLSSNDNTFRSTPLGEYIRRQFPEPSPYEKPAPPKPAKTEPRRPVRYHSVGSRLRPVTA